MFRTLWKNQAEFYPYIAILYFWADTALNSLIVKNRPGIVVLGMITIPSVILISTAVIKTFIELKSNQSQKI